MHRALIVPAIVVLALLALTLPHARSAAHDVAPQLASAAPPRAAALRPGLDDPRSLDPRATDGLGRGRLPEGLVTGRRTIADAMNAHDFARAAGACEGVLAAFPTDRWTRLVRSDALVELGRVDEAEALVQGVLELKPTGAAYLRAAWLLHLRGDDAGAVAIYGLALDALDDRDLVARAWTHAELGRLAWCAGRGDEALRQADLALALAPACAEALLGKARALAARGDLSGATALLERAPASPEALSELAALHAARGWQADADEALDRARRLLDQDPLWSRAVAVALADHGLEPARAVALAEAELARRPDLFSHDAMAWALARAGRGPEALAHAERALALGAREPALLFHAGMAARAAGDAPRARAWLGQALALNPAFHPRHALEARAALAELTAR